MGLLLHMMKIYFSTGRYVILDSVFYVLKGLIQLSNKGVFACAFIKNRRHWPYMVLVKDIENQFGEVEVGDTDAIMGLFQMHMRILFPFLHAKDLCTPLLIMKHCSFLTFLYVWGTYPRLVYTW